MTTYRLTMDDDGCYLECRDSYGESYTLESASDWTDLADAIRCRLAVGHHPDDQRVALWAAVDECDERARRAGEA